jgi:hypothetical protein
MPSLSSRPSVWARYKKNLKHLHVAHPTFLMKVMTWFLQVFISPKFFNKVRAVRALLQPNPFRLVLLGPVD